MNVAKKGNMENDIKISSNMERDNQGDNLRFSQE